MPQGSETILVVEDDPRLRKVLGKRLRSLGYQIIEEDSGAAALEQLAARPDIAMIFTDMVMPGGMTGFDLARGSRSHTRLTNWRRKFARFFMTLRLERGHSLCFRLSKAPAPRRPDVTVICISPTTSQNGAAGGPSSPFTGQGQCALPVHDIFFLRNGFRRPCAL